MQDGDLSDDIGPGGGLGAERLERTGGLAAQVQRWLADRRVDEAVAARTQDAWLQRQAAEEATMTGILMDLAEWRRPVAVTLPGTHRVTGTIRAVGRDFVAVRSGLDDVLVRTGSVLAVWPDRRQRVSTGARPAALATTFVDALAWVVGERPAVVVVSGCGARQRGELRSVGVDVLTLQADDEERAIVYVPIASVAAVRLVASHPSG